MNKITRTFALATMTTLASIGATIGQENTNTEPEPPKSGVVYKGLTWGLTDTNLTDPTMNLLSANVFKHTKSGGFGIMALAVTQPSNIRKDGKSVLPLVSMLAHWGNKDMNVNIGPITKLNGGPLVDGYRGIVNVNPKGESRVGGRIIVDADKNLERATNVAAHILYKVAKNTEFTAGSNTKGNVQLGFSYNY